EEPNAAQASLLTKGGATRADARIELQSIDFLALQIVAGSNTEQRPGTLLLVGGQQESLLEQLPSTLRLSAVQCLVRTPEELRQTHSFLGGHERRLEQHNPRRALRCHSRVWQLRGWRPASRGATGRQYQERERHAERHVASRSRT